MASSETGASQKMTAPDKPQPTTSASIQPNIATGNAADEDETTDTKPAAIAPDIAPAIAPAIATDTEGEDDTAPSKADIAARMAPSIVTDDSDEKEEPVSATKLPAPASQAGAQIKPDIATDQPADAQPIVAATIKPDIAADNSTESNRKSTNAGIAPDITAEDEPATAAAVDPEISEEEVSSEEVSSEEVSEEETPDETEPATNVAVAASNQPDNVVLAPVPDPAIVAETLKGPLPVISADGREAWRVYARPFRDDNPDKILIAILLGGMGMSQSATNAAIQQLPGEVTLSFAPYARSLSQWISGARAAGHEVMLELPMEPLSYPANDPGPHTLLTSLSPGENIDRMEWLLSRFVGYVGVTSFMGSKFTTSPDHLRPILTELKQRGLLFLDTGATRESVAARLGLDMGLPIAVSDRFFDRRASRVAIDAQLLELEQIANRRTIAVGIGYPYPVTIERLAAWIPSLAQKGIELAPVSAVVDRIHRARRRTTTAATTTPG